MVCFCNIHMHTIHHRPHKWQHAYVDTRACMHAQMHCSYQVIDSRPKKHKHSEDFKYLYTGVLLRCQTTLFGNRCFYTSQAQVSLQPAMWHCCVCLIRCCDFFTFWWSLATTTVMVSEPCCHRCSTSSTDVWTDPSLQIQTKEVIPCIAYRSFTNPLLRQRR